VNAAHLHLILNHVPILGAALAFVVLAAGALRRRAAVRRLGLATLVLAALAALPVYFSGEPAEKVVEDLPGITETVIERHEDAAKVSFALLELLGVSSLLTLIVFRKREAPGWLTTGLLVLSLGAASLIGWTGFLGGQIRHSELRAGAPASAPAGGAEQVEDDRD
jgi:hypothetical protein